MGIQAILSPFGYTRSLAQNVSGDDQKSCSWYANRLIKVTNLYMPSISRAFF